MKAVAPSELVKSRGGRYACELGIDLGAPDAAERFKWFLAALLYGARISEPLARRTWHEFAARGVLTPARIVATGWDGLVALLDAGGYVRYDYKTATKLLDVCAALLRDYGGSLDALHAAASGPRDLETRLKALGKGIGDTTVGIFLRELRGIWDKAAPPLSPLALAAATALGYQRSAQSMTPSERLPNCNRYGLPMGIWRPALPSSSRHWCARGCVCAARPHASVLPGDSGRW